MKPIQLAVSAACALFLAGVQAAPLYAACWTEDRSDIASDELVEAYQGSRLEEDVRLVSRRLKEDRLLASLEGYRLQLNSYVSFPAGDENSPNYAEIWVGLHGRDVWLGGCDIDQGEADYNLRASIRFVINDVREFEAVSAPADDTPLAPFMLAPVTGKNHGHPVYAGSAMILGPKGVPLVRPYLLRDHLEESKLGFKVLEAAGAGAYATDQIKAIDDYMTGDGRALLDQQTAFGPLLRPEGVMWAYSLASDEGALPRVYLNPDLKQAEGKPMRSRVVLVRTDVNLGSNDIDPEGDGTNPEAEALKATLERWIAETDFSFLEDRLQ